MGVGVECRFARALQDLAERRFAGKISAQYKCIGEKADEVLQLVMVAVCNYGSDYHVLRIGVSSQQRLEAGEQPHEQSATFGLRERFKALGQVGG